MDQSSIISKNTYYIYHRPQFLPNIRKYFSDPKPVLHFLIFRKRNFKRFYLTTDMIYPKFNKFGVKVNF